ncbi:hypothetical protein GH714_032318 [Hevea brasiliensis]|uniref:Uncharacterized protein n=1 Tax=Hevea brasiliensis TaxID=3981 RepID=A0A6A6LKT9_HEVBR|nr:hypothetical protein GH714_032318 [Hevea brasiliensis]
MSQDGFCFSLRKRKIVRVIGHESPGHESSVYSGSSVMDYGLGFRIWVVEFIYVTAVIDWAPPRVSVRLGGNMALFWVHALAGSG